MLSRLLRPAPAPRPRPVVVVPDLTREEVAHRAAVAALLAR